jgi:hypothetical protein
MKRSVVLLSGVGIGAGLLYLFKSSRRSSASVPDGDGSNRNTNDGAENAARLGDGQGSSSRRDLNADSDVERSSMGKLDGEIGVDAAGDRTNSSEPVIDDRGTDQHEAAEILKSIRDAAFDSNNEKLALALGRPIEEIEAWTSGSGDIDGDVVMKARTLAMTRGVEI